MYGLVATHPILSPHGHLDPSLSMEDATFADPVALFIRDDHYVTRLLHDDGMALYSIGPRRCWDEVDICTVWRYFCKPWHLFAGTASGYWLRSILEDDFGITRPLTEKYADELYDGIDSALQRPEMRPRALPPGVS